MNRLHNLDYLRGLAAAGIMVFHYLSWTLGDFPSTHVVGRIGIYGVSVFYVLSGLTLFYVYFDKMKPSVADLKDFYLKRIFRIFPLLWLATAASVLVNRLHPSASDLFLNFSGLFGFFRWDGALSVGAWSIGNELVFYIFFPIFVFLAKHSRTGLMIFSAMILAVYLWFAFVILPAPELNNTDYVNPLNQVFLFLSGFLMGLWFKNTELKPGIVLLMLAAGLAAFVIYPTHGPEVALVTGWNRVVFTAICLLVCFSFYKFSIALPAFISKPLGLLGEASYSVYLLHPLAYAFSGWILQQLAAQGMALPERIRLLLAIGITLGGGILVYRYFEKYFMRLAKRFTAPATEKSKP